MNTDRESQARRTAEATRSLRLALAAKDDRALHRHFQTFVASGAMRATYTRTT